MAAIRKFLFDTDFADVADPEAGTEPEDADAPEDGEEASAPVEEPPPPVFSEEDLEIARGQGFAEGKEEGVREAAAAVEQQIADTLAQIGGRLPELFTAQETAAADLQRDGVMVIRALARKVLPRLAERDATDEIEHLAKIVLDRLRNEPRVVFRVNGSVDESIRKRVTDIAAGNGFAGSIEVVADTDVAVGDCRIEWTDGGAERRTAALLEEIDQIIARNLGGAADEAFVEAAPGTSDADPSAVDGTAPPAAADGEDGRTGDAPEEH